MVKPRNPKPAPKPVSKPTHQDWRAAARRELDARDDKTLTAHTPDGIAIKALYTAEDLAALETHDTLPGFPPYVRGPYASMYAGRPWTVRQYAGFSSAEDTNAFFRANLAAGQTGLSVAFDLPTHRGFDSDHPRVAGDVGQAGVAIDTVEDMKILFRDIPLDRISVSMTMNGAVLPVLAAFIVAAEEQGVAPERLTGTIQNDILKEFIVRNTYIYPPAHSMRIVGDIVAYATRHMPRFNSISISGYHMQEAGATVVQELAFTLADGVAYVRTALAAGLEIDDFAPRLSFFFNVGMNFFLEVAKLRAARLLWAELMAPFGPKNPRSSVLRTHCQTSGVSLTSQDPHNNIVRTTIEALAAVLGGTQSLHTNAFDEAISLPTPFSARIARNTQLILAEETGIADVIDPLGGSYYLETLTRDVAAAARALIGDIEAMGGMIEAVERGLPQRLITEAAVGKQARVDRGEDVIVGVNKYVSDTEETVDVLEIDSDAVRQRQIDRLASVRAGRDDAACRHALAALRDAARAKTENLLAAVIAAMKARASVGEVTAALEEVFTRYRAPAVSVSGVYGAAYGNRDTGLDAIRADVAAFTADTGRKPRMLVVKLGQDGHDRGAKVIAAAFADIGFEVILGPLFQSPEEAAQEAIENAVHIVGVSTHAGGHKTLVPQLTTALRAAGGGDILVACGGVIPDRDRALLRAAGVDAVFGPGTQIPKAAAEILAAIRHGRSARPAASEIGS
ncbi:MAG: methylmalonyl-CoA mutase [Rhodospirillales bacterium]